MKYLLSVFAVALSCTVYAQSFQPLPDNNEHLVQQAADKGMHSFLDMIPEGSEEQFGYTNRSDINKSVTGKPYHVLILSKDFYRSKTLAGSDYILESNEWRVPVVTAGTSRNLLTVTGKNNKYTAEDIGGAGLAKELEQVVLKRGQNNNCYILRVYPLTADFFVDCPTGSFADARFIPLASARMAMPSLDNTTTGYSLQETLSTIKTTLKNSPKN